MNDKWKDEITVDQEVDMLKRVAQSGTIQSRIFAWQPGT
jgi:hypothetical protein